MPAPVGVPAVNWDHPLSVGLAFCAGPYSAWTDLVRGIRPSAAPVTAHGVAAYGRTSTTDGTNQVTYASTATPHLDFTTAPFSVLWVGSVAATAGVYPLGPGRTNYVSEASNNGWVFAVRADADTKPGLVLQPMANNGVAVYGAGNAGAGAVTNGKQFVALAVSTGAPAQSLYLNGARVATATSANPVSAGSTSLVIGGNATAAQTHVAIWARALSAAEAAQLASDPFCFLRSPS